jgi:hypothetical protein
MILKVTGDDVKLIENDFKSNRGRCKTDREDFKSDKNDWRVNREGVYWIRDRE